MKIKRTDIVIDLANMLQGFLVFYSFIAVLLFVLDSTSLTSTLWLLPSVLLSYLIRSFSRHIWSFLGLHTILTLIYVFTAADPVTAVFYGLYLVLLTAYSFYQKQRTDKRANTSIYYSTLFFFLYMICRYFKLTAVLPFILGVFILFILIHFLNMYLFNFNNFINNHSSITNLPYHQIKNSNNTLIFFLLSLFLIIMYLFTKLPLDGFFVSLGKMLRFLLLSFLSLFSEQQENTTKEKADAVFTPMLPKASSDPSRFAEIISAIFYWFGIIFITVAAISALLYVLYKLYQYFYAKNNNQLKDRVEFISPFVKTEGLRKKNPFQRFLPSFGRTGNELIRKHFYKAVISSVTSPEELPKHLTPSELADYIMKEEDGSDSAEKEVKIDQLTKYYEKARFSDLECSKEEVSQVKNILKGKGKSGKSQH
jgi:hypothetical protein